MAADQIRSDRGEWSKRSKTENSGVSKLLKTWSGRRGSNPRRPAWEAGILPLNYSRLAFFSYLADSFGLSRTDRSLFRPCCLFHTTCLDAEMDSKTDSTSFRNPLSLH